MPTNASKVILRFLAACDCSTFWGQEDALFRRFGQAKTSKREEIEERNGDELEDEESSDEESEEEEQQQREVEIEGGLSFDYDILRQLKKGISEKLTLFTESFRRYQQAQKLVSYAKEHPDEVYPNFGKPRGLALIINNHDFGTHRRIGTNLDRDNLTALFCQMGYVTQNADNLTNDAKNAKICKRAAQKVRKVTKSKGEAEPFRLMVTESSVTLVCPNSCPCDSTIWLMVYLFKRFAK
ncbi:hypothetical protein niasHT_031729 [Heterodera trifolii]|uniref:Caspase family p20 domain-containing protein n=1 Tax=Heterodera trifolii TaxID=157864 RepID=A0ABD2IY51_9BILA